MSELKKKMTRFIIEQGADNKILKTIFDSIEEWKKKPAYEYIPPEKNFQKITLDPSKDKAGEIREIKGKTIGDVAREEDIFSSYTGDRWTSYSMHNGYIFPKVGNVVLIEVRTILYELKTEFISQNSQEFIDYFQEYIEYFFHDYYGFDEDKPTMEFFSPPLDEDAIDMMMIFMDSNDEFSDYDEEFMEMYIPDYCFLFDYNLL